MLGFIELRTCSVWDMIRAHRGLSRQRSQVPFACTLASTTCLRVYSCGSSARFRIMSSSLRNCPCAGRPTLS